ncbi:(deoxy)nucleoside triphosphate pyrophosphohydrolase [Aestuariimicrobium soli]|uniref:(deoxy)nucleoside triphosphate pyrophosphohydrolase n=1 Tax=Aestuariimicrobium soli TaxID=2035834 RepID=UPI003EC05195
MAADRRRLVVAGLLVRDGRLLAAQRSYPDDLAGLWEFPGGKVEPGEEPGRALVRELREELGLEVTVGEVLEGPDDGLWPINDRWAIKAFWCEAGDREPQALEHAALRWVADADEVEWLPADVAIASAALNAAP